CPPAHPGCATAPCRAPLRSPQAGRYWLRMMRQRCVYASRASLAVADGAVGQALHLDVVLLHKLLAVRLAVDVSGRLPAHGEDLFARADVALRLTVALEAPAHVHGVCLLHQR